MLKLSNKGLYGVKALYELAKNYGGLAISIKEISKRHGMPVQFLEQVLHQLKIKGLVKSRRGVNGGYILARHPGEITIGDAVRALDGPIALCECLSNRNSNENTVKELHCVTSDIYKKLGKKVEEAFDSVTLNELVNESIKETYVGSC